MLVVMFSSWLLCNYRIEYMQLFPLTETFTYTIGPNWSRGGCWIFQFPVQASRLIYWWPTKKSDAWSDIEYMFGSGREQYFADIKRNCEQFIDSVNIVCTEAPHLS